MVCLFIASTAAKTQDSDPSQKQDSDPSQKQIQVPRSPSRSPRSTLLDPRSTPLDPHGLVSAVRPRYDGRHFPAPAPNSVMQDAQEKPTPGPSSTEGPEHQVSPVTTNTEIPPLVPPPGAAVLTAEILEYVEGKFREAEASPNHRFSMKFDVEIQGNDLLTLK
ncbi:unnamed protein product, partial [Cyprideis torosa]